MLAKDQVINTYRALNNWRSFRLKLCIEGIIIGILSGLIISFFRWSLHLVETNREHIYTFLKNTDCYWTAFWFIALAVIAFTLDRLTKYDLIMSCAGINIHRMIKIHNAGSYAGYCSMSSICI